MQPKPTLDEGDAEPQSDHKQSNYGEGPVPFVIIPVIIPEGCGHVSAKVFNQPTFMFIAALCGSVCVIPSCPSFPCCN